MRDGDAPVRERFVDEPIEPVEGTYDTQRMATGEPGLPREFVWRGRTVGILSVIRTWHTTGPCRHGSPEMYVRRHWYEVAVSTGGTMKIYFDRQPKKGSRGSRWWLFSMNA